MEDITDICEICDKPVSKCRCDVSEDAEGTIFNPIDEEEARREPNFSSM